IIGKTVPDIFPGEMGDKYRAADRELFQRQGKQEYETPLVHQDGTVHYVVVNKATFSGPDGKVAGLIGIILDISERKQAEERLKESEQRYRAFFTTSQDSVFITSREGKFLDFNDALLGMIGNSREEILKINVPDLYKNPEDRKKHTQIIEAQGFIKEYPVDLRRKDGTIIHTLITSVAVRDSDGAVVEFQGTIRDVTDHRRAEEERNRHLAQIAIMNQIVLAAASSLGSDELLRTSLQNILRFTDFDAGAAHMLDKDGRKVRLVASMGFLPLGEPGTMDLDLQDPVIRSTFVDGKSLYRESATQGFYGSAGSRMEAFAIIPLLVGVKVVGTIAIASHKPHIFTPPERNLLESIGREIGTGLIKEMLQEEVNSGFVKSQLTLKELEKTVRERDAEIERRQQIEKALRLARKKLDLMDSITRHDIVNQLMVLMAHLHMSQEAETDPEKRSAIEKELMAAQTIQQQIEFTRDYQDIGSRSAEWIPVGSIIRSLIKGLNFGTIAIEESLGDLQVFADPLFEKVIFTLIDNALRYGKVLTRIDLSFCMAGEDLVLVCEDNGIGIPDEHKVGIFHREYFNHTGLGLYLSQEILSITGFTIRETGMFGKGARFEIRVPHGAFRFGGTIAPGQ
ncbi:MAG: PAS domain S-box protein, partial [Methanomicrobiales archaeon]|nr:PAS domain S-box protein [Methanomicrobiales archaeon]